MERIVFRKDVNTDNNKTLESGDTSESTPTFVRVGFPARTKFIHKHMTMHHLIVCLIQMPFVKEDPKNILLTESSGTFLIVF